MTGRPWPPRKHRPKFAVSKVCRIQLFYRAKMLNIMCKCAESFSFWGLCPPDALPELGYWTTLGHFRSPASLATLSGNESFCSSLRLCFSNDVCSAPNCHRTRNQSHRCIHGWMTLTKILVWISLYCIKCTKFGQLILRKILLKLLSPDVRF